MMTIRRVKLAVLLTIAVVTLAAVVGCGDDASSTTSASAGEPSTTGDTAASTTSTSSETAEAGDVVSIAEADAAARGPKVDPPTNKKIGFLLLSSETEADMTIFQSVKDAAAAFGFEVVMTDWNFDPAKLPGAASALLAQDPDLFIIDAADPTKITDVLAECEEKGIPVLLISAQQNPSEYVTGNFVPDEKEMARLIDQYFFDQMEKRFGSDKTLEIAAFQGTVVGPGVQARDVQRHEDVAAHGNIDEVYTHEIDLNDPIQDAIKTTKLVMSQAPELAGIWETADLCVAPHAQALAAMEIPVEERPVIIGFYSTQQSRQAMKDGEVAGCVDLDLGQQGYFSIDQAVEYWARGTAIAPDLDTLRQQYGIDLQKPFLTTQENVAADPVPMPSSGLDYVSYFRAKWAAEFGIPAN